MSDSDIEIVVDDPTAPEADSPAVTDTRVVDVAVSVLLVVLAATPGPEVPHGDDQPAALQRTVEVITLAVILAFSALLMWDNWRTGISWDSTGPQAGYFPFYLSIILAGASLYGLASAFTARNEISETFVTRAQLRRVMQVFVPTLLFCLATQFLGLYVASFLLIAIFMRMVGRIALWKSLLTAFLFTAIMFVTFDIAFDVIMPKGPLEAAFGY